jgi:Kdo2-lipid IVA lauroyltransferase/acyltransferase
LGKLKDSGIESSVQNENGAQELGSGSGEGRSDAERAAPWYQHKYHTPLSLKIVFCTIPKLPKIIHPPIAAVTALIFFLLLGKERQAIIKNLRHICPAGSLRTLWKAYQTFYSFCDFIVSYCYVPGASHSQLKSMLSDPDRGAEKIENCLRKGNGLIVWTAHLGNWEFASRLLEMHCAQVHVARVVEKNKPAEILLRNLMQNDRLKIEDLSSDILASIRLIHALRNNEIVAIQGDRIYSNYCGAAKFFGQDTRFPLGPFLLSYISGAPVLPGFVVRDKWLRYRVIMGDPILMDPAAGQEEELQRALKEAVVFLQENAQAYSDQWLNFFDFWSVQSLSGSHHEQN